MRHLEDERDRRKNPRTPGSTQQVRDLPQAIQRRLANSGFSNDQFIRSPNKFIYEEAAQKIKMHEVAIALRDKEFKLDNILLVTTVHTSYFQISGHLVVPLLTHPHCPQGYATGKLNEMEVQKANPNIRTKLEMIAQNAENSNIKNKAAKILNEK